MCRLRETAPSSNWPDQLTSDRLHLEVTRDTNGPGKSACREPLSKRRAEAVSGIRQDTAKARTAIDLRQSDLPALAFILLSPSWRRGIASTCFAQVTARSFAHAAGSFNSSLIDRPGPVFEATDIVDIVVTHTRRGARGSHSRIGIDQHLLLGTLMRKHIDEGTNLRREMMAVWINRVHRKFHRPVFGQQTNQTAFLKIGMD